MNTLPEVTIQKITVKKYKGRPPGKVAKFFNKYAFVPMKQPYSVEIKEVKNGIN
jgi:hypothetical protein